jgi:hypothetical protein
MASELNYTLGLKVNEDYFLSYEMCKLNDTPLFYKLDGMKTRRYARINGERYRVKETLRPIDGLIPYVKSGK